MNPVHRAFLLICLLAFTGQPLVASAAVGCDDHDMPVTDAAIETTAMDHSQHQSMSHYGYEDGADRNASTKTDDCCEIECGDCNLHHAPSLLVAGQPHRLSGLSQQKYFLTVENLISTPPSSLYKPPNSPIKHPKSVY